MKRKHIITAVLVLLLFGLAARGYRAGVTPQPPSYNNELKQPASVGVPLPPLPEQAGQLKLQTSYSGAAAMRDIVRLHNSSFPLANGVIALYESEMSEMTAWISVSPDEAEAKKLMSLMVDKMPASGMFQEKAVFETAGLTVYYVTGMNMDHYYWLDGIYVYWLAIQDSSPRDILDSFLMN